MEKVKKVSQKELNRIALRYNAKRIGYNSSYYESIIHSSFNLIDTLKIRVRNFGDTYNDIIITQLYYCCGVYGNTGQMHRIEYYDTNDRYHYCYVYFTNINYNYDKE